MFPDNPGLSAATEKGTEFKAGKSLKEVFR